MVVLFAFSYAKIQGTQDTGMTEAILSICSKLGMANIQTPGPLLGLRGAEKQQLDMQSKSTNFLDNHLAHQHGKKEQQKSQGREARKGT